VGDGAASSTCLPGGSGHGTESQHHAHLSVGVWWPRVPTVVLRAPSTPEHWCQWRRPVLPTGTGGTLGKEGLWERRDWKNGKRGFLEASKPVPGAGTQGRWAFQLACWQPSSFSGRGCVCPAQCVAYKALSAGSCCSRAPWAVVPPLSRRV